MKAIAQDAGKTAQVELAPVEPDKLVGKLAAPLTSSAKVVVKGALSEGHSLLKLSVLHPHLREPANDINNRRCFDFLTD